MWFIFKKYLLKASLIVAVSYIFHLVFIDWWLLNSLIVFLVCEIYRVKNASPSETNDAQSAEPVNKLTNHNEQFLGSIVGYFLNRFKPFIIEAILDFESEIRQKGLKFEFLSLEIDEMVSLKYLSRAWADFVSLCYNRVDLRV